MAGVGRGSARGLAAGAVVLLLPLAACSSAGDEAKPAGGRKSASPSPTVEPAEYKAELTEALKPFNRALAHVDSASGAKALEHAVDEAAGKAESAVERLTAVKAPDDAFETQSELAGALTRYAQELGDAVKGDSRCAVAPRSELHDARARKDAHAAIERLDDLGYTTKLHKVKTEKPKKRRLANGAFIEGGPGGGLGKLTLRNGSESDAAVTFARGRSPLFTLYLRKGKSAQVNNVANGTYTVFFTTGTDWNSAEKAFSRGCSFEKFDDKARFTTRSVQGGTQYSVLTFSLQKSLGGNATTSEVPEGAYPS
ncbi:hypothetical protein [Streptomyces sulphureus]|uniref:hypothetical protein n=1 Tax=Streptomyces sulphureus TaxID=47758 RepID=UPI00035F81B5|nr:hypothetical protein [Streptomyces sulphureus]